MKNLIPWAKSDIRPLLLLGLLALIAWPLLAKSPYDLRMFTTVGIYALMALGYQFVFGHIGALSLTQGCFFGLGAYTTGILSTRYGLGGETTLVLSALVPVLVAAIVAAPVLRLQSHYFALATLGVGQVVLLLAIAWQDVTGGSNGLYGIPNFTVGSFEVPRGYGMVVLVWSLVALGALVSWLVTRGFYGAGMSVVRENPTAAQSIGLDTAAFRYATFLLSALYGGVAGAMYAHSIHVVSIDTLEFPVMVSCLTIAVVGGRTRIAGAILGAVLVVNLPEWFRASAKYYLIAYGIVLLLMVIIAPDGVIGFLQGMRERLLGRVPPALPANVTAEPLPAAPRSATTDADGDTLLEVVSVGKRFGGLKALDGVTLTVRKGEIVGLIGANGSGKSTLLNVTTGIYRADAGSVRLHGEDITRMSAHRIARRGVARTFQNLNLVDDMSVLDNVAIARFGFEQAGLRRTLTAGWRDRAWSRARNHAMYLLAALGVDHVARLPAGGLAYGLKRKVEIARALALQPQLLLLDEPAAGLNESEQLDLAERLRAFASGGLSVLVIEHNMPFLLPLVDRLACLERGTVIATGTPDEVLADAHVIASYLGMPEEIAA
jgi:branched-chain amino acid transport system permease protein